MAVQRYRGGGIEGRSPTQSGAQIRHAGRGRCAPSQRLKGGVALSQAEGTGVGQG